jgi:NAD(P)-dependent dehydrogenase (short-subunit alcohol dehydrogenase family)
MMRTALVTGSSSGFGRGVVTALLERGWKVYATLRDAPKRKHLFAEDAKKYGDRLVLLALDVTEAAERAAVIAKVNADGRLDCLINNAGYGLFGACEDLSEQQLRRQLEVNFFSVVLLTKELLPALRAARGVLLNVSSAFGATGFPLTGAYCASKFALEGWSESLYYELKPHGVRVGVVAPGGHRTGFVANLQWAAAKSATYAAQVAGYQRLQQKLSSGKGTPGDGVVRTLVRLAEAKHVPLRTAVGKDAQALAAFQGLLPRGLRAPASSFLFSRLLRGGQAT